MRRLLPLVLLLSCDGGPEDTDVQQRCPYLTVDTDTLRFEDALFEAPTTHTLQVSFPCEGADLVLDDLELDGDPLFVVEPREVLLPAGGAVAVDVRFEPDGSYEGHAAALRIRTAAGEATVSLVGRADPDQDGDGVRAAAAGGADCDDLDPRVGEPGPESRNLVDDDCDGLIDEDFIEVGDVWITELMLRPASARTSVGQWVEVHNRSTAAVDLQGFVLDGTEGALSVAESVVVEAGEYAVLAVEPEPADNGGVAVDGRLVGAGSPLAIRDWSLALSVDGRVLVALDSSSDWPDTLGATVALDPTLDDVREVTHPGPWCSGTDPMPNDDLGTPGAENAWCPQIDHDQDGYPVTEGDCDDTDPEVGRLQLEVWDGKDNDCDGLVDDLFADVARAGRAYGPALSALGGDGGLQIADWTRDGIDDVIALEGRYSGKTIWVVDGSLLHAASEDYVGDLLPARIDVTEGSALAVAPTPSDLDGDGDDDLLLLQSSVYAGEGDLIWLFDAPPSLGVTATVEDSDARVLDPGRTTVFAGAVRGHLDPDGDGQHDVVLADQRDLYGVVQVLDLEGASGTLEADDVEVSIWTATAGRSLGQHLEGADLDGDGYDDLLAGELDTGRTGSAAVHVVYGAAEPAADGGLAAAGATRLTGLNGALGLRAWPMDLDDDGALDLVVGDPADDMAYVLFDGDRLSGSVDVPARADVTITSDKGLCATDAALADLGRDGTADLTLGCFSRTTMERGVVMVLPTAALTTGAELDAGDASMTLLAEEPGDGFGRWARPIDLYGVGLRGELLVTAPTTQGTSTWQRGDLFTFERR